MLGEQIRHIRRAKGVKQVELAKMLGVSKQSISNWENGNIMPSIEMLKKICTCFSCSADYLLELETDKNLIISTENLKVEQVAHLNTLANDFRKINNEYENLCNMLHK